jgi:hypothetical protein
MTYTKPELIKLDSAVNAIQGSKQCAAISDPNPPPSQSTSTAYQADE